MKLNPWRYFQRRRVRRVGAQIIWGIRYIESKYGPPSGADLQVPPGRDLS